MKPKNRITVYTVLIVASFLITTGCTQIATDPLSPIRIEVTGTSVNPVDIDWTVHSASGTLASRILNNGTASPVVIEQYVPLADYGEVGFAVSDSGATSNLAVLSGLTVIGFTGFTEKVLTLDTDTEVPPGSGNFVVGLGDFFEDAAGNLMFILQDPTVNREILVSDVNGDFTNGAWTLYKSNRSTITVTVTRDGLSLHTSTGSTNIDPVDLSYGSYAW
jgi:hypothetical protein